MAPSPAQTTNPRGLSTKGKTFLIERVNENVVVGPPDAPKFAQMANDEVAELATELSIERMKTKLA